MKAVVLSVMRIYEHLRKYINSVLRNLWLILISSTC